MAPAGARAGTGLRKGIPHGSQGHQDGARAVLITRLRGRSTGPGPTAQVERSVNPSGAEFKVVCSPSWRFVATCVQSSLLTLQSGVPKRRLSPCGDAQAPALDRSPGACTAHRAAACPREKARKMTTVNTVASVELDDAELVRVAVPSGAEAHAVPLIGSGRRAGSRVRQGAGTRGGCRQPALDLRDDPEGLDRLLSGPEPPPATLPEPPATGDRPRPRWDWATWLSGIGQCLQTALGWLAATAWVSLACSALSPLHGHGTGLLGHMPFQPTKPPSAGGAARRFNLAQRFPVHPPIKKRSSSWFVFASPPRPPRAVAPVWPKAVLPPPPRKPVKAPRMVRAQAPGKSVLLARAAVPPLRPSPAPSLAQAPRPARPRVSVQPVRAMPPAGAVRARNAPPPLPSDPVGACLRARVARMLRAFGSTLIAASGFQKARA